jgi:hypothetical protein
MYPHSHLGIRYQARQKAAIEQCFPDKESSLIGKVKFIRVEAAGPAAQLLRGLMMCPLIL